MTQTPSHSAGVTPPRLLQLLAQSGAPLADGPLPCCGERLGRLFGLSDTLVLDSAIAFRARHPGMDQGSTFERIIQELATTRTALIRKIKQYGDDIEPANEVDVEPWLNTWLTLQRRVTAASRQLRDKTRKAMKDHSQNLARLAELDATFDHAMAGYTSQCFSHISKVLEQRFHALSSAEQTTSELSHETGIAPDDWLHRYCEEAQNLLLAELDVRLEPVLGLLEACHNEVMDSP
ncbi:DUF3348 family protein [Marinobacter salexigens]|uniref:DUF3348 family protein n=1 Tax=Marinobacter salexigens TaxID=1925763 RepID=UPI000C28F0BB|nr:DUF3348 family protein [Marinobacter salexigens]